MLNERIITPAERQILIEQMNQYCKCQWINPQLIENTMICASFWCALQINEPSFSRVNRGNQADMMNKQMIKTLTDVLVSFKSEPQSEILLNYLTNHWIEQQIKKAPASLLNDEQKKELIRKLIAFLKKR